MARLVDIDDLEIGDTVYTIGPRSNSGHYSFYSGIVQRVGASLDLFDVIVGYKDLFGGTLTRQAKNRATLTNVSELQIFVL